MNRTCVQCGKEFYYNGVRKHCFICAPHRTLPSSEEVVRQYNLGQTCMDLAQKYKVNYSTVYAYIRNFGLLREPYVKIHVDFRKLDLDLDFVDGWLLGDGNLTLHKRSRNAIGCHTSKYRVYVEYIIKKWEEMGLAHSRVYQIPRISEKGTRYCSFQSFTLTHPSLTEQYRRWYPQGFKVIPSDVSVSRVSLREWYLGDGCFHTRDKTPMLCMGGVTEGEVDMMWEKLMEIFGGEYLTKTVRNQKGLSKIGKFYRPVWVLSFGKSKASRFFDYIGECPLYCYQYKWPEMGK